MLAECRYKRNEAGKVGFRRGACEMLDLDVVLASARVAGDTATGAVVVVVVELQLSGVHQLPVNTSVL